MSRSRLLGTTLQSSGLEIRARRVEADVGRIAISKSKSFPSQDPLRRHEAPIEPLSGLEI